MAPCWVHALRLALDFFWFALLPVFAEEVAITRRIIDFLVFKVVEIPLREADIESELGHQVAL